MSDRRDLSGVWYGRYSASNYQEENSFIALIEEALGVLDGSVSEPDDQGTAGIRRASLTGLREGALVRFVKQYDGRGGFTHAVRYEGQVNEEGTEVTGRWNVDGWHGRFVMEREKFSAEELEAEDEETLDEAVLVPAGPSRARRRRSRVMPPETRRGS